MKAVIWRMFQHMRREWEKMVRTRDVYGMLLRHRDASLTKKPVMAQLPAHIASYINAVVEWPFVEPRYMDNQVERWGKDVFEITGSRIGALELGRVNFAFVLRNPGVIGALEDRRSLITRWPAGVQGTEAQTQLFQNLKDRIAQELYIEGRGIREVKQGIQGVFEEQYRNQAERIARTETNWVLSTASYEQYSRSGVEYKEWLAEGDACDDCRACAADGIIPMADSFSTGWASPADAHPNCRCDLAPVIREEVKPWNGE